MISITSIGDFSKTQEFLEKSNDPLLIEKILNKYGDLGVAALSYNTPRRTGKTASSWRYEITSGSGSYEINFINDNVNKGVNIAVIIQYGHGTRNGGYVRGLDYINPALEPVFEKMVNELWEEVIRA